MDRQKPSYNPSQAVQEHFGSFEAADLLGVKRSIVNNDMKQGYICFGTKMKWGRTVRTLFSRRDIYLLSLFYELHSTGLSKRQAIEIVKSIGSEPHDYIVLKTTGNPDDPSGRLHFKDYLSVQVLDEIKKSGATLIINYKKIRQDMDDRLCSAPSFRHPMDLTASR
ncbi:hypothetical protein [uncultured Desulfosarcina sp.]|uniref:hypothetical protein n=1 Tax=uncultured Desulfosarcina sp. TaxID=218289 RepID=UPI0029C99E50|nr:hypothetical protein [uncultured Desulfosarcina sp.]